MPTITYGPIPFGIVETKELRAFPDGESIIILAPSEFVRIAIRTNEGTREFYPNEVDGFWEPFFEVQKNETTEGAIPIWDAFVESEIEKIKRTGLLPSYVQ